MLRGDPVAPELRWRDEVGVHRSQSRPRPSPREQLGTERFAAGRVRSWRTEPGWRGNPRIAAARFARRSVRVPARYRPGASGGWRQTRSGSGREGGRDGGAKAAGECPRVGVARGPRGSGDRGGGQGPPIPGG
jgi:hypothetical protein